MKRCALYMYAHALFPLYDLYALTRGNTSSLNINHHQRRQVALCSRDVLFCCVESMEGKHRIMCRKLEGKLVQLAISQDIVSFYKKHFGPLYGSGLLMIW